ncbi:MAG: SLBB domain-containing protein [Candidatus Azotimanducaceae bacterium]
MRSVTQNGFWALCLGLLAVGNSFVPQAAAALPNIPPAMLAQLKNMSPAQQAALARQYGIELPTDGMVGGGEPSTVGQPGEALMLDERVQQRLVDAELERLLAEAEADEGDGEEVEEPLKRFGLELFDREISTFSPVDDMPAPDGYLVGPGDSINLYLYGNEEVDVALSVNREGQLILPRLGPLSVAGLTFEQVKELIEAKVASQLVATKAVVSLGTLRAINVFLAGDVFAPGSYSVSGLSTVLQVLYAGGGVSEIGSLRNIQVKRRGKVIATLDAYDILLRGDTSGDVRLASGDTVFVATAERLVAVDGEVKRPAIYETLQNDTLGDLLQMSGGISASGYAKMASIERRVPGQSSVTRVQVDLDNSKDLSRGLFDGDRLVVAAIKEEVGNQVLLRGAAARPGGYAWFDGQRITDLVGSLDDDLLSETDLSTGLIVRRTGVGLEIEAIAFDLGEAISNRGGTADLMLQEKDEVLIFALPYLNDSYQALVDAAAENENVSKDTDAFEMGFQLGPNGEPVFQLGPNGEPVYVFQGEEEAKEERRYEDRNDLIKEVVFRLEAQAKSPSSTNVVDVAGDVRLPGRYPLLGDRSMDALIALAGGFENSAFLEEAEVTRLKFDPRGGARISTFKVGLKTAAEGEFQLQPLDRVRVSRIPNWSYGDTVEISGSVVFPGDYPIVPGEMLSSLLSRAGGVSENAFPQGAVLVKVEAKKREQEQLEGLIATIQRNVLAQSQTREQDNNASSSDAQSDLEFLEEVLSKEAVGRVVIDLPALLAGNVDADIQLEAGDSLFVPEFNNTISVIGEVRQPGNFRYESDRSVADYVEFAAGTTVRAETKKTYVVRANGSVQQVAMKTSLLSFTPTGSSELEAGDTIIVPVNEEYQPALARYKEVSTVVFQSIASLYPLFRL